MKKLSVVFLGACAMLLAAGYPSLSVAKVIKPDKPGRICGTIKGLTCPQAEYCFYSGGTCGIADMAGICKPRPRMCTRIYMPVCGCNGKTYGNSCEAARAGVSAKHPGKCKKQ
jgi:hypothetical protein